MSQILSEVFRIFQNSLNFKHSKCLPFLGWMMWFLLFRSDPEGPHSGIYPFTEAWLGKAVKQTQDKQHLSRPPGTHISTWHCPSRLWPFLQQLSWSETWKNGLRKNSKCQGAGHRRKGLSSESSTPDGWAARQEAGSRACFKGKAGVPGACPEREDSGLQAPQAAWWTGFWRPSRINVQRRENIPEGSGRMGG